MGIYATAPRPGRIRLSVGGERIPATRAVAIHNSNLGIVTVLQTPLTGESRWIGGSGGLQTRTRCEYVPCTLADNSAQASFSTGCRSHLLPAVDGPSLVGPTPARNGSGRRGRWGPGRQGRLPPPKEGLGTVHTCMVVATEAIFSQHQTARAPCRYTTPASANAGLPENGPVPSGCAANAAMLRCAAIIQV